MTTSLQGKILRVFGIALPITQGIIDQLLESDKCSIIIRNYAFWPTHKLILGTGRSVVGSCDVNVLVECQVLTHLRSLMNNYYLRTTGKMEWLTKMVMSKTYLVMMKRLHSKKR